MKMTNREKEVAMNYITRRIHNEKYGVLRNYRDTVSLRDEMEFKHNGWKLEENRIEKNGKVMYLIHYKEKALKPRLEYVGG